MASAQQRPREHDGAASWINVERKQRYAILTLQREPVNTMNLKFWELLTAALDDLEADPSIDGVILTSGLKRDVFTAGNDIMELYAPATSADRYATFWRISNTLLARLNRSRLATVAAIRGACPAGGCCLSLCCDHRVMTAAGSIGLNEVLLGIPVPKYWGALMARVIGLSAADRLLQRGAMVNPQEALRLGLVDEVVEPSSLLARAEAAMQGLLRVPSQARALTKVNMRGDFCAEWEAFCVEEAVGAWAMLESPSVQGAIKRYLDRLSAAAKQAKL